jgi:alpha-D-ribose 1-methylphosphonate 5-triphosphate synthase subunit PhnL
MVCGRGDLEFVALREGNSGSGKSRHHRVLSERYRSARGHSWATNFLQRIDVAKAAAASESMRTIDRIVDEPIEGVSVSMPARSCPFVRRLSPIYRANNKLPA